MKLGKEQKSDLIKRLRNVVKPDIGNEQNPKKFHNDIEVGAGGNTVQIGINENIRKIIREIVEEIVNKK